VITAEQVHEAIPVKGAERALAVYIMSKRDHRIGQIEAFARGILEFLRFQAEQSHVARMTCAISVNKIVTDLAQWKSERGER
jgi:hypothetical protein